MKTEYLILTILLAVLAGCITQNQNPDQNQKTIVANASNLNSDNTTKENIRANFVNEVAKLIAVSFNRNLTKTDFETVEKFKPNNQNYSDLVEEAEFFVNINDTEHAAHTLGTLHVLVLTDKYEVCAWHGLNHIV